jgi:signal peptidase I
VLVPGALATVAFVALVPHHGTGLRGAIALLAHRYSMAFAIALFLLFSGITRYWLDRALPVREGTQGHKRALAEMGRLAIMVIAAASAALVIREYVARPYRVLSGSMLPTFEPQDLVAGRKLRFSDSATGAPARGEVVAFRGGALASASGRSWPDALVKRVIGLPGDVVAMRGTTPVINGWQVPWCDAGEYLYVLPDVGGRAIHGRLRVEFLDDRAYLTVHTPGATFDGGYEVKPGEVFVLGDNRGNSLDSRAYGSGAGGGVPVAALEARIDRFLAGTHRSGSADFGRFLRPVDALETRLRLEGVATQDLEVGIAKCMSQRPLETHAPEPSAALHSRSDRAN